MRLTKICLIAIALLLLSRLDVLFAQDATDNGGVNPLTRAEWLLLEINGNEASLMTEVILVFLEDGLYGNAGCNDYFGTYELEFEDGSLSIGMPGATRKLCPSEAVMAQETTYLETLNNVTSYTIQESRLHLIDENGDVLLVFAPVGNINLSETAWQLSAMDDAAVNDNLPPITMAFSVENASGSGGCNRYFAPYTVGTERFSMGVIGSTLAMCDDAVINREQDYFEKLASAEYYTIGEDGLVLFNAAREEVLRYVMVEEN